MNKIKIAEDTPAELIDIFKQINLDKIPFDKHDEIIDLLKKHAQQHIPLRVGKVNAIEIELAGCPQRLATIVSQFNFKELSAFKKKAGMIFIKTFLKNNGLLK